MASFLWFNNKKTVPQATGKDLFSTSIFTSSASAFITENEALKVPAVKASVELISNSISTLPIYLYAELDDKSVQKVKDPRTAVLNEDANNHEAAQVIKKKIVQDYLLRGKAYIYKKDGKLYHLEAKNVEEQTFTEDGFTMSRKQYEYRGFNTVTLFEHEVIEVDSGTNGLLADQGELFKTALNQLTYNSTIMENGALPAGILKATSRLTETAITRLRSSFEGLYSGHNKAGKTIILEEGLDYSSLSLNPNELQFNESIKQTTADIARAFNLPESMINSAANKYNSLEQNHISFLQNTLTPIITAIESAFSKHLLLPMEKEQGLFFRFDTSEIIRATEKEKVDVVANSLKSGLISMNEARYKLDMKPIEEDYFALSIGQVLKYKDGRMENLNLLGQQQQTGGEINQNEN
ncbi:phage portal protein [Bacillus sp. SJS]|uniref:phage portal protein n=1 Tax=Bacillus sp. SJS TaxID=1423321 RepID=UPI000AA49007|nr:phage portal protein [Bacillus sp. SJS]